jgi:hypothetical protein
MVHARLISTVAIGILALSMPAGARAADPSASWIYFNPHVPLAVTDSGEVVLQGSTAPDGSCRGGLNDAVPAWAG